MPSKRRDPETLKADRQLAKLARALKGENTTTAESTPAATPPVSIWPGMPPVPLAARPPTRSREEIAADVLRDAEALRQAAINLQAESAVEDPGDRAKIYASCASTLQTVGRMVGVSADLDERKILRTPAWRRVESAIFAALAELPPEVRDPAVRAIRAALGDLG